MVSFLIVTSLAAARADLPNNLQVSPRVPSTSALGRSTQRVLLAPSELLPWHRDLESSLKPTDSTSSLISEQLPRSCQHDKHAKRMLKKKWFTGTNGQRINTLTYQTVNYFLFFCWFSFGFVFTFTPSDRTKGHPAFICGDWHDHAGRGELVKLQRGHRTLKQS